MHNVQEIRNGLRYYIILFIFVDFGTIYMIPRVRSGLGCDPQKVYWIYRFTQVHRKNAGGGGVGGGVGV